MMKCHQCAKPAVVHLTEVVRESEGVSMAGEEIAGGTGKRAVEMHLCMQHAIEAGLMVPVKDEAKVTIKPSGGKVGKKQEEARAAEASGGGAGGAIVPAHAGPTSLAVTRDRSRQAGDGAVCPECGMTWGQFKQTGQMGCAHDYVHFAGRMMPLLKRAQEGGTEHAGKVPARSKTAEGDRQVVTLRLRRELQKALHAEHYEQAAALRDKLRQLEN